MSFFPNANHLRLGAVAILLVAVAGVPLALLPFRARITAENEETQKAVVRLEHARAKIGQLAEFRTQNQEIEARESEVNLLLSQADFPSFIEALEESAQECGGEITVEDGGDPSALRQASKKKTKEEKAPRIIDDLPDGEAILLNVRFFGAYPDAVDFLHKVETMPHFLDVLSVDIAAVDPFEEETSSRSGMLLAVTDTKAESASSSENPLRPVVEATFSVIVHMKER